MDGGALSRWRFVAAAAAASGVLALAPAAPAARAGTAQPDWSALSTCSGFFRTSVTLTPTGYRVVDVDYGYRWDERVLTRDAWRNPPPADEVRQLHVYGLAWLPSLLASIRNAHEPERVDGVVAAVAAAAVWRPDNGRPTDPVWNEGATLRRLQAVTCLFRLTHDERLVPALDALAGAASDPKRYVGPPLRPPHNHGLMTDLALLDIGRLLHRADWIALALTRMRLSIAEAFTASGLSVEGSSAYHVGNLAKWADAARILIAGTDPAERALARVIDVVVARGRRATAFLGQPDGIPVPFGDGQAARQPVVPQRATVLADRRAGVVAGRWSWAAPDDYYAVRFGPARAAHGHEDRMSVVWWTTGRPVLVDPGTATYVAGARHDWTEGQAAHSVPLVRGQAFRRLAPIVLATTAFRGARHAVALRGMPYGRLQTRTLTVDAETNSLSVRDAVRGGSLSQVLQLDPRWRPVRVDSGGRRAVFVDATGASLVVATSGRIASLVRGASGLAGGWTWNYPPERRTPAARLVVAGGASLLTVLRVRGAALRPWLPGQG